MVSVTSFVIRFVKRDSSIFEFFVTDSPNSCCAIVDFFDFFDSKPCDYELIEIYVKAMEEVWSV